MTRTALAQKADLGTATALDVETGQQLPTVGTIARLASALSVSAPWLAYGIGAQSSEGNAASCDGMAVRLRVSRTDGGHTRTTLVNAALSEQKKEFAITSIIAWAKSQQEALWSQYLTALRGGAQRIRPDKNEGANWAQGGVHCSVYLKTNQWDKIGESYLAKEGDRRDDHAEMQWKTAHAAAFVQSLPNATKAEFHISKVCCDEWCSEKMIAWWATLAPPDGFTGAFIYTYQDEQAGKHIYELTSSAIVHLGSWG